MQLTRIEKENADFFIDDLRMIRRMRQSIRSR